MSGAMIAVAAVDLVTLALVAACAVGWALAGVAGQARAAAGRRLARAARAAHEIRGPLCGVGLGVEGLAALPREAQARRLEAIGLELDRAALAAAELTHAVGGGWRAGPEFGTRRWARRVPARGARRWARRAPEGGARRWARRAREGGARRWSWRAAEGGALGEAWLLGGGAGVACADVVAVARRAEPGWRLLATAGRGSLELRTGVEAAVVAVPPARLAQALGNLVANAVRHGGGHVTVEIAGTPSGVRIEVVDDGPGLPAALGALLGRRPGGDGHGHGLGVVAAVASEHGGRLSTAPSAGGARLVLELPRPATSAARARRGAA